MCDTSDMNKQRKPLYQSTLMRILTLALGHKRPHGGTGVWALELAIDKLFPGEVERDGCGNMHIDRRSDPKHRTLFVAHLDTVHRADGRNRVNWAVDGWAQAVKGQPLGADDGAGVAILCHMLEAKVPGYYVFTQGEERGGIGATFLAKNSPDLLSQFDRAIAFDRRDVYSVISHQGMGRCCSDKFAEALSERLSDHGLLFGADDTGVYTDTAEFTHLIPECTNISVGYYDEHTDRERLDLRHFKALAKTVAKLAWDKLPTARDPVAEAAAELDGWWGKYTLKTKPKKASRYARADFDMIDALEAAEMGSNGPLARILAATWLGEEADLVERTVRRMRIDATTIEDAFDNIEMFGAGIAADAMLEKLVRRQ